jgi:hypothetical protein
METPDSRMKISVPLDDWELNFLIDLLGPPEDMSPRTLKLYRTLKELACLACMSRRNRRTRQLRNFTEQTPI